MRLDREHTPFHSNCGALTEIRADNEFLRLVDQALAGSNDGLCYFDGLFDRIFSGETCIIRGTTGSSRYDLLDLPLLSRHQRYVDDRGRQEIRIIVDPWNTWDAERRLAGFFHTDFSQSDPIPDILAIRCDRPDPRHPHFSRNQVVRVVDLIHHLDRIAPAALSLLLNNRMPYKIRGQNSNSTALSLSPHPWIKYHPSYIDHSRMNDSWFIDGMRIDFIVEEVAHAAAVDFVLGQGDIFFCSNKTCLHRRGEASVKWTEGGARITREITTRRFLRG